MKTTEVPQDESMLAGHRRACYAVDEHGRYVVVPSKGWQAENIVNAQAVEEIRRAVEAVRGRVHLGRASPLEYHMVRCQMTPGLLASYTGLWSWRVRRHLKPEIFARLKPALLTRYAQAFGISVEALGSVPTSTGTPS
jgi:hypothetical protein